jgi:hypothetical protein
MNWKKKVSRGLNQGFDQSKHLLKKAKKQAIIIGEQTLLNTEITELCQKEDALYKKLGQDIYDLLINRGKTSVSVRTPEIKDIFTELGKVISDISVKKMQAEKDKKN